MSQIENISLSKLSAWKGNVRKTAITEGLDELKASIAAHGLLNPLTVQKGDKGERRVIAGQRRLLALRALQKDGTITADHPVPCTIVSAESDLTEISLAENVVRTAMHPADQFEAFRDLLDKGHGVADVAARFGISDSLVTKRMTLGRVSPAMLDLYRRGDMTLEQVQALALSSDHAQQERVWNDAKGWQRQPRELRSALTTGEVSADDRRVAFIGGLARYEAAGGTVRRDLFDAENAGYLTNLTLLNELVTDTLEQTAAELRAEGWKWVETAQEIDWSALRGYGQVHPSTVELTRQQQLELDALTEQYDELASLSEEEALTDEQQQRFEEVEAAIDSLQSRQRVYRSEDIARAGVVVAIAYRGGLDIRRGLVKPEDEVTAPAAPSGESEEASAKEETGIPGSLVEDITAQRTAALRVELAKRPHVALAATVYTLACRELHIRTERSCLKMLVNPVWLKPLLKHPDQSPPFVMTETDHPLVAALPVNELDLWQHCLGLNDADLLALLAVLVAPGIDAIDYKSGARASLHARQLAHAVDLDMTMHFDPTAETYFSRLPKPEIIKAICEMDSKALPSDVHKLKKAALAALAEKTFEASGRKWLPEPLRVAASAPESADEIDRDDEVSDAA